jgi:hypothetical protein
MGSTQQFRLEHELRDVPDESRESYERVYDDIWYKREEKHHKPQRTDLGRIFEAAFLGFVLRPLERRLKGKIEVITNEKQGYDVYVQLKGTNKWIIIELKNWNTYFVTPDMLNRNFFQRKPYAKIEGKLVKIAERDIIGRFLIFSNRVELDEEAKHKLRENRVDVLMGDTVFDNSERIGYSARRFLNKCLSRIALYVRRILRHNTANDSLTEEQEAYLLQQLYWHSLASITGVFDVLLGISHFDSITSKPPDTPISFNFLSFKSYTSIIKSKYPNTIGIHLQFSFHSYSSFIAPRFYCVSHYATSLEHPDAQ